MRGKFRDSYEHPQPFEPGRVTRVEYVLPDAYHTFRRGHRIMVQIQSSWFPLYDRNPQTFVPSIMWAEDADYKAQTHRVHHSSDHQSYIEVEAKAND